MIFGASRRGRGLSRPFWLLVGMGIAVWRVANLGWMCYEGVLRSEPPMTSAVRFLFGFEDVFIAMALFLDQDKDSSRIDVEAILDFVQIGIVFFFISVEFYFSPAHRLDEHTAFKLHGSKRSGECFVFHSLEFPSSVVPRGWPSASAAKQRVRIKS